VSRRPLVLVVGTRPEAIKLAPVALAAARSGSLDPVILATGQHDHLVVDALASFGLAVDVALPLDRGYGSSQPQLLARLLPSIEAALDRIDPAAVLVQGDTASAYSGAMAGTLRQTPVAHLEAGLRSFDKANPFPEESYRRLIAAVADLHLPPTPWAAANLRAEGVPGHAIVCTGNTVVDAAQLIGARARAAPDPLVSSIRRAGRRLVLVTVHRRENWGAPLRSILAAVARVAEGLPDVEVVLPVHPNPVVRSAVHEVLGDRPRVHVIEPLDYAGFLAHLSAATLVLSDSGGVQEEAPTFGVPVLVLRDTTERPEAVQAGSAELVGTDQEHIVQRARHLLLDEAARQEMAQIANPFGDGTSGRRTVGALTWLVDGGVQPPSWEPAPGDVVASGPVPA